jgi:hypothetical protein
MSLANNPHSSMSVRISSTISPKRAGLQRDSNGSGERSLAAPYQQVVASKGLGILRLLGKARRTYGN